MVDRLTFVLPAVVGVLYLGTSAAFLAQRRPAWALTYFAYALANVGIIWASIPKGTP